jgi:hypothetical protein
MVNTFVLINIMNVSVYEKAIIENDGHNCPRSAQGSASTRSVF